MMHRTAERCAVGFVFLPLLRGVALKFSGFLSVGVRLRIRPDAFFLSDMRNSLENGHGQFHYSVIGQLATALLATGYVGCRSFYDDAASDLKSIILGGYMELGRCCAHPLATSGSSPGSGRLHNRTGERKIKLNDCDFVEDMQGALAPKDIGIMGIDENIHATHPPYATVAPILDGSVCKLPAYRGFTLNNGAADANGR